MSIEHVLPGAVTQDQVWVRARITGASARLAVADNPELTGPAWFGPDTPTSDSMVSLLATGLDPDTRYWWAVEEDGLLHTTQGGTIRTHPVVGDPANFAFSCAGDAGLNPDHPGVGPVAAPGQLSNHPVYDLIRRHRQLWHTPLGDQCYYDLGSGNHGLDPAATLAQYRGMYSDIAIQPRLARLVRSVPVGGWMWDDHDYGPGNSTSTAPGRDNACLAYRERIPHYPLGAGAGAHPIYQSWQVARAQFLLSDGRADRVTGSTMLGSAQIDWLESVLSTSDAEYLIWFMSSPWLGLASDTWAGFPAERAQLAELLGSYGWLHRTVMISADKHVIAGDSGRNNSDGYFPNLLAAPIDANPGSITTQYDQGMYAYRGQYGTVHVRDHGHLVDVTATGWRNSLPRLSFTHRIATSTPAATVFDLGYDPRLSRVEISAADLAGVHVRDTFTREVTDGWGSSDSGDPWTVEGGTVGTGPAATVTDNSTAGTDFDTGLTVPLPASWSPGDLAIVVFNVNDNAETLGPTPADQGWTALDASPVEVSSMELGIWWRILQAGDGDPSITVTDDQKIAGGVITITGHDKAGPIAVVGTRGTRGASSTDTTAPGISTTHDTQLILGFYAEKSSASTVFTPPAGMTSEAVQFTGGGGQASVALASEVIATAGATGDRTASYDVASAAGYGILLGVRSAGDFEVTDGVGRMIHHTVAERHWANIGDYTDVEVTAQITAPPVATGAPITAGVTVRRADADNLYLANLVCQTTGVVDLVLWLRHAGAWTMLTTGGSVPYDPGFRLHIRVLAAADHLYARVWREGNPEPTAWTVTAVDDTHTSGAVGFHSQLEPGCTNATPVNIHFDNLDAHRPLSSVEVQRSTDQRTWSTIRGGVVTPVDLTTDVALSDYEFTSDTTNYYRLQLLASTGQTTGTLTGQLSTPLDAVWIKTITSPWLNQAAEIRDRSEVTRPARGGLFDVVGRSYPVAVTDVRGSRRYTLELVVESMTEAREWELILSSGDTVLVHVPDGKPIPGGYYVVGDTTEVRPVIVGEEWRYIQLPLVQVAIPGPDVLARSITWRGVANRYATWADLAAANSTWRAVPALIGTPQDVVIP